MKRLGTAPNLLWFTAWLMDQGEKKEDWRYIRNVSYLEDGYRDVDIHVIVGYPSGFARPHGWEWARAVMAAHNITEIREV